MMYHRKTLEDCGESIGVVIVIDVIRAFTTSAFAFDAGAKQIVLLGSVEEALILARRDPAGFVMGEVGGLPPPDFDTGNSPHDIGELDLGARTVYQRTSAGTQGIVRCMKADILLASSFVVAKATADYVRHLSPKEVTFVITGHRSDGSGDEDAACADYLERLIQGDSPNPREYLKRVIRSRSSVTMFANPSKPEFLWEDIKCCIDLDRFCFAMVVERNDKLLILRPISIKNEQEVEI